MSGTWYPAVSPPILRSCRHGPSAHVAPGFWTTPSEDRHGMECFVEAAVWPYGGQNWMTQNCLLFCSSFFYPQTLDLDLNMAWISIDNEVNLVTSIPIPRLDLRCAPAPCRRRCTAGRCEQATMNGCCRRWRWKGPAKTAMAHRRRRQQLSRFGLLITGLAGLQCQNRRKVVAEGCRPQNRRVILCDSYRFFWFARKLAKWTPTHQAQN
jgi:hypothetical protein